MSPEPAIYDDVLAAPAHMVAEVLAGELHLQPRPAIAHALATSALGEELGPPFKRGKGGPGGWWIVDEPELHLHPEWRAGIMDALRALAPRAQIIVATHADEPWDQAMSFERFLLVPPDDLRSEEQRQAASAEE